MKAKVPQDPFANERIARLEKEWRLIIDGLTDRAHTESVERETRALYEKIERFYWPRRKYPLRR